VLVFTCLLATRLGSSVHAAPPEAARRPASALGPVHEAKVSGVDVELTVWRGGDRAPSIEGRESKRIPRRRAQVEGRARYLLSPDGGESRELVLLDFADFMHEEPDGLDEIALSTYVAGASERARTTVRAASVDGRPVSVLRRGSRRDLVVALPPGAREVTLEYVVEVPHRYWPLGCVWRHCSLSGAIAPLPSEPARGGVWLPPGGRSVSPVPWTVSSARFGAVPEWEPGTSPTPEQARDLDDQELVVTREASDPRAAIAYPSVFWGPRWHRSEAWHRGVHIQVLHLERRPLDQYPDEHLLAPIRDVSGHVIAIARETIDLAASLGIEPIPDAQMTIVQGPVRTSVAELHPTVITVSDQYLEMLAVRRLSKFHDIVVARTLGEFLAHGHFSGQQDGSVGIWLPSALGVAMAQLWQHNRELRDEYAADLLAALTFVPAIDRFLYTGQAAFSSAYFRGSEDKMPVRYHPLYFANDLPTGRRIHEKMVDLMGEQTTAQFYVDAVASPQSDPVMVAEQAWGRRLDWFFDQWLGVYPEVDYAIEALHSTLLPTGHWRHEIVVTREADRPLLEAIQVYVVEKGGQDHYLVWNGEAETGPALIDQPTWHRHRFVLETDREIDVIRLDPRRRLVQQSRSPVGRHNRGDNNDPLFNDRRPAKSRFLYTGIGFQVAASELVNATTPQARLNAMSALIAFEGSSQRDLRRTYNLSLSTTRETIVGGSVAANFWLGRKRSRQRRRLRLRTSATAAWLNRQGLDANGGLRLGQAFRLVHSTKRFGLWPERGHNLYAGISAGQTLRLDGANDHRYTMGVGAGWSQVWPLAHHHVLATRLDLGLVVPLGSDPEFRSLLRGGGIDGLAGFSGSELFGLAMLLTGVEYRHVLLDDLRLPLLNLAWLRTIGGVLFGGVSSLSNCENYGGLFGARSWYGQIGYGLTARLQILGVTPQFFRVDVAAPLGRKTGRRCLGETFPDYLAEAQGRPGADAARLLPPVNVNISFNQPF